MEEPLQSSQKDCVFQALRFSDGKKYEIYAAVILDDHVHIIINPTEMSNEGSSSKLATRRSKLMPTLLKRQNSAAET